jgi:hypothetical protein
MAVLMISLVLAAGQSAAQDKGSGGSGGEMQQARKEAEKYSQKLKNIQKDALKNNPGLKKQREELRNLHRQKLDEMVSENATRREKMKAYMKLRQDKELRQKKQQYRKDMKEAMQKEDPKTEEYIKKFRDARRKMRQQQRQGAGQSQGGQEQ